MMIEEGLQKPIEFHTPLWMVVGVDERTDIRAVVNTWKTAFLRGEHAKTYEVLSGGAKKKSKWLAPFKIIAAITKWFWPILVLAAVSFFSLPPAIFLSVVLIPIQVFIFTIIFIKVYDGMCINSVIKLEERLASD
jgi:hypothetical protein